jgi:hypothetical protein
MGRGQSPRNEGGVGKGGGFFPKRGAQHECGGQVG